MKKKRALAASRMPDDYTEHTPVDGMKVHNNPANRANTITLYAGGDEPNEMLRIAKDGFYVRGVKLEQDEKEAALVYNAFREWMTWAALTRQY